MSAIADLCLVSAGVGAVVVSIIDFLQIRWSSASESPPSVVSIVTLIGLGLLLIATVVERRARLDTLQEGIDKLGATIAFGTQYLATASEVSVALERVVDASSESIMTVGSRSRAEKYLSAITVAVTNRGAIYYRVLDGAYVYHELHLHLSALLSFPNVQIAWTPREKYPNLTVGDSDTVIAFPSPYVDKFSGLRVPGERESKRYAQQVLAIYSRCIPVRDESALAHLCRECGEALPRDLAALTDVLTQRQIDFVSRQGRAIRTDSAAAGGTEGHRSDGASATDL